MIWTALADAIDTHRVEQYCKETWKCSIQSWSIIFSKFSANVGKFLSYQICLLTLSCLFIKLFEFDFLFHVWRVQLYMFHNQKSRAKKMLGKPLLVLLPINLHAWISQSVVTSAWRSNSAYLRDTSRQIQQWKLFWFVSQSWPSVWVSRGEQQTDSTAWPMEGSIIMEASLVDISTSTEGVLITLQIVLVTSTRQEILTRTINIKISIPTPSKSQCLKNLIQDCS